MSTTNWRSRFEKTEGLGDRPDWILRMLYAPVRGRTALPIVGKTRIMKACFLMDRKLKSEFEIETDFKFKAADYGPFDPKVYDAIDELKEAQLITTGESESYQGTEYSLTVSGRERAKSEFKQLSSEQRELLSWIKGKHVLKPLSKLLSFVYNQYPEMAENSKME